MITCSWVWEDYTFVSIYSTAPPRLCSHRSSSRLVTELEGNCSPLPKNSVSAYFYCTFSSRESQDVINVVGSLVAQVCRLSNELPPELKRAFMHSKYGNKRPTLELLGDILIKISQTRRIALLIDAVDECDDRGRLLRFMSDLRETCGHINILITSRKEADIAQLLSSFSNVSMEDHVKDVDEDISLYIQTKLETDERIQWLKEPVKAEILRTLNYRSAGM